MIKFITCLAILFCSLQMHALEAPFLAHFSAELKNLQEKKLLLGIYQESATDILERIKWSTISINKQGRFDFDVPVLKNSITRIFLKTYQGSVSVLYNHIVEAADKIKFTVSYTEDGGTKLSFIGNNSKRYKCIDSINLVSIDGLKEEQEVEKSIRRYDDILSEKIGILNRYRAYLSPFIYELIKADIVGSCKTTVLEYSKFAWIFTRGGGMDRSHEMLMSENEKLSNKIYLNSFAKELNFYFDTALSQSPEYLHYLCKKEETKLAYEHGGANFNFKELYSSIRNSYSGIVREKLLGTCFFEYTGTRFSYNYSGIDPLEYLNCLKDALLVIKDASDTRIYIEKLLDRFANGAVPLNFSLLQDSTSKRCALSDFEGKVVLLDLWTYICGGCWEFAKAFHETIYPQFKSDTNFVYLSVMVSGNRKQYLQRLRREGVTKNGYYIYTYPDYVNLYGGEGTGMEEAINKHYDVASRGFPFILLIGKNGKIYSSTLPLFVKSDSPNTKNLTSEIKKALSEPKK